MHNFPPPEQRSYSQAMRAGIEMMPRQAFGVARAKDGATDAHQAAIDGAGALPADLKLRWPIINVDVRCTCGLRGKLWEIVDHLNHGHCWTREAIADFVESVERDHSQPAESQPLAEVLA